VYIKYKNNLLRFYRNIRVYGFISITVIICKVLVYLIETDIIPGSTHEALVCISIAFQHPKLPVSRNNIPGSFFKNIHNSRV